MICKQIHGSIRMRLNVHTCHTPWKNQKVQGTRGICLPKPQKRRMDRWTDSKQQQQQHSSRCQQETAKPNKLVETINKYTSKYKPERLLCLGLNKYLFVVSNNIPSTWEKKTTNEPNRTEPNRTGPNRAREVIPSCTLHTYLRCDKNINIHTAVAP